MRTTRIHALCLAAGVLTPFARAVAQDGPAPSAGGVSVTNSSQMPANRPHQAGRVAGQLVVGGAAGLAASIGLGLAGAALTSDCCGDDPGLIGAVYGAIAGAALGPAIPVYLIGKAGPNQGSLGATLLGGLSGAVLFLGVLGAAELDSDNPPFWIALYGLPAAGAVAGYYLSARRPTPSGISVPLEGARVSLAPTWRGGPGLSASVTF
jgi:hypothetical protein